jgi:hypothetical protein
MSSGNSGSTVAVAGPQLRVVSYFPFSGVLIGAGAGGGCVVRAGVVPTGGGVGAAVPDFAGVG